MQGFPNPGFQPQHRAASNSYEDILATYYRWYILTGPQGDMDSARLLWTDSVIPDEILTTMMCAVSNRNDSLQIFAIR